VFARLEFDDPVHKEHWIAVRKYGLKDVDLQRFGHVFSYGV
jgi:hypothetical protein